MRCLLNPPRIRKTYHFRYNCIELQDICKSPGMYRRKHGCWQEGYRSYDSDRHRTPSEGLGPHSLHNLCAQRTVADQNTCMLTYGHNWRRQYQVSHSGRHNGGCRFRSRRLILLKLGIMKILNGSPGYVIIEAAS